MVESRELKLCFVMFRAYTMFNREISETMGGSEVELYNLATWFAGYENVKVDFIVGDYGQPAIETYGNIRLKKVKYMRLDRYTSLGHKFLRYFYLFKILLTQNSQVFFTKTASELIGWIVIFQKYLRGKKVVFRLGSDKDADLEFWRASRKLYHLYKFGLKHSDLVYAQTKDQQKLLKENCSIDSRVLKNVFYLRRQDIGVKKEFILWVSRCEPLKRPLLFVELAKRLPDENFVIVMPHARKADELSNARINRIIEEVKKASEILGNLEYLEFIPYDRIQDYYNRARLFVNTSLYEGFPNSFIQSCIGRTGILSFRVDPDGFLEDYGLGFYCSDSLDQATDFIHSLNDRKVESLGENALSYVINNHDIKNIGRIYAEDFLKLTGNKLYKKGACKSEEV